MNFLQATPSRQVMATLELDDSERSFTVLRTLCASTVELRRQPSSPDGYQWIDLLLADASAGGVRPDEAAVVLSVVEASAATFGAFRIVHGDHWLRRAAFLRDDASKRALGAS